MARGQIRFYRVPARNLTIMMLCLLNYVFLCLSPVLTNSIKETEFKDLDKQTILGTDNSAIVNSITNQILQEEYIDAITRNKDFLDLVNKKVYIRNDLIDSKKIQTKPSVNEPTLSEEVDTFNHTSIDNINLSNFRDNSSLMTETTPSVYDTVLTVSLTVLLITIILAAIIGNAFVIAAILLEKNLQGFQNYLTISLAVADLLIGLLDMPFAIYYQLNKEWTLGPVLCDFWTSIDVLCCTASILNLVAIAFDRYWLVTDFNYTRSTSRIIAMIVAVWSMSFVVAVAPQFGWMDSDHLNRVLIEHECLPSLDLGYYIFSYTICILIPLPVILFLYWKIYQTARKSLKWREEQRIAKSNILKTKRGSYEPTLGKRKRVISNNTVFKSKGIKVKVEPTAPCDGPSSTSMSGTVSGNGDSGSTNDESLPMTTTIVSISDDQSTLTTLSSTKGTTHATRPTPHTPPNNPKIKNKNCCQDIRRENKTAMILAIITGAFMVCWIPFFTSYFLYTMCRLEFPFDVIIILAFLAYMNSALNPIIYTIFSPEFRKAFKRMFSRIRFSKNQR